MLRITSRADLRETDRAPARGRLRDCALVTLVFLLVAVAPAGAQPWPEGRDAGSVEPVHLAGTRALGPVNDAIPARSSVRAARHAPPPSRVERVTDQHGHQINIGTNLAGLDLRGVAGVLAGTVHGAEISKVRVIVTTAASVARECGSDERVLACYIPDGTRSTTGEMVVGHDEPDLRHSAVHEYGHHIDAQYENITPARGCLRSNDGTRRWFFERDRVDDLAEKTGCRSTPYTRLLGEIFAEDFVALNGIVDWSLPTLPPPAPSVLAALSTDLQQPFRASARAFRGSVRRRRAITRQFRLETWTFVSATVSGPRAADLDLFLFRRGGRRALAASTHTGSSERVRRLLPPGDYDLEYSPPERPEAIEPRCACAERCRS